MTAAPESNSRRERFVFLGAGLALAGALVVGLAREQQWGARFVDMHLLSTNAEGLRSGQEIRISGIPVGKVKALQLQPDAVVKVSLAVQERYANLIGPKSIARLGQEGLVGEHFLVIIADPQPRRATTSANGWQLSYQQPLAIDNLMNRLLATQSELQRTLENTTRLTQRDLPNTLNSVNRLAATMEREAGLTTPAIRQTLNQLRQTGSSAEQTSRQAQQILQQSQPLLINTLKEVEQLASSSRKILQSLLGLSGADP